MQNDIWDPINALIDDAQRDQEFKDWWEQVGEWTEKVNLCLFDNHLLLLTDGRCRFF